MVKAMRSAVQRLKPLLAGFAWLLSGQGASYLLSGLTFVLVARMLGPGDYGLIQAAWAYIGIVGALRLSGFDKVLTREVAAASDKGAGIYARFLGLYLLTAGAVVVISLVLLPFVSLEQASQLIVIIALPVVVFQGFSLTWIAVFTGHMAFRTLVFTDLARQIAYLALVAVLWLSPMPTADRVYVLAGAQVLSYGVGFAARYIAARRFLDRPVRPALPRLPWSIWRAGLILSAYGILIALFTKIDVLLANSWLSPEQVGLYSVAYNASNKATGLVSLSGVVLFPALAKRFSRKGPLSHTELARGTGAYALGWTILAAFLWLAAPLLIGSFFGEDYVGSVTSFRVLLIAGLFSAVLYPISTYVIAIGDESILLIPMAIRAVLNIAADIAFLALGAGIVGVAWASVIAWLAYGIALVLLYLRRERQRSRSAAST